MTVAGSKQQTAPNEAVVGSDAESRRTRELPDPSTHPVKGPSMQMDQPLAIDPQSISGLASRPADLGREAASSGVHGMEDEATQLSMVARRLSGAGLTVDDMRMPACGSQRDSPVIEQVKPPSMEVKQPAAVASVDPAAERNKQAGLRMIGRVLARWLSARMLRLLHQWLTSVQRYPIVAAPAELDSVSKQAGRSEEQVVPVSGPTPLEKRSRKQSEGSQTIESLQSTQQTPQQQQQEWFNNTPQQSQPQQPPLQPPQQQQDWFTNTPQESQPQQPHLQPPRQQQEWFKNKPHQSQQQQQQQQQQARRLTPCGAKATTSVCTTSGCEGRCGVNFKQ